MKSIYEKQPLPECAGCQYRASRLYDEEIRESTPRLLCPLSIDRACGKSSCLIERPTENPRDSLVMLTLLNK